MVFLFNILIALLYPSVFIFLVLIVAFLGREKKIGKVFLALGVVLFYFMANGIIPQLLVDPLEHHLAPISDQKIAAHKAMIVLGGGINQHNAIQPTILAKSRVFEAFRIYNVALQKHHVQYTIFLSGGHSSSAILSEAQLEKDVLLQLGVPAQYVVIEGKSLNTYQNAQYLKPILARYPFTDYLLVTSGIHMKRAMKYFEHFGINVTASPSDFLYPTVAPWPNAYNLLLQKMAVHEYGGILRLPLYNALGLNDEYSAHTP